MMRHTWRWFGPHDQVSLQAMLQAGVQGVVTALHHIPTGDVWQESAIAERQSDIGFLPDGSPSGLAWEVVESLPVSEAIKKQSGDWRDHVANYKTSLRNLSAAGISTLCYNFMPVLDWTRTDLRWRLPNGATCMRFDYTAFAMFDIHILERPGADEDYSRQTAVLAEQQFSTMDDTAKRLLADNIVCGLPGAAENFSLDDVRQHLAEYDNISADQLRNNFTDFLQQVIPVAEELGIRMCCHPDDPPFNLLGLPRVMSTEQDYNVMMKAVDSPANGITLCSGSLGARPDNDLPGMLERLGDRVHFLHLRNVKRESTDTRGSFHEAEHLGGDTDMVALIAAVLKEEKRRRNVGRHDHAIPMRPDHGQDILDDLERSGVQPGYPAVGRLKGLAEMRGIEAALHHVSAGGDR
jgi:mannonate dehydratase